MVKKYYKIRLHLDSALSLGSGNDVNTDNDLLKDSLGHPFIPGSSLAGIYRKTYREFFSDPEEGKQKSEEYFGKVDIATQTQQKVEAFQSQLYVYDATLLDQKYTIANRDGVGLDEYKTAISGAKFDFEVLEAGVELQTYIEQEGGHNVAARVLSYLKKNGISIGAKTKRGLGKLSVTEIKEAQFDLKDPDMLKAWLSFDMYGMEGWNDFKELEETESARTVTLSLGLKQEGGLSIRQYTTDVTEERNKSLPDYRQLAYENNNGKRYALIPGTTWAGAFRHQLKKLHVSEADLRSLFGTVKGEEAHASRIRFSESEIEIGDHAAREKIISRNAIDRFTGGAISGALYTERFVYGGRTEVKITIPQDTKTSLKKGLAAAVADLHSGYLAVGGLTSVGRGLFSIETVNGTAVTEDNIFDFVCTVFASKQSGSEE